MDGNGDIEPSFVLFFNGARGFFLLMAITIDTMIWVCMKMGDVPIFLHISIGKLMLNHHITWGCPLSFQTRLYILVIYTNMGIWGVLLHLLGAFLPILLRPNGSEINSCWRGSMYRPTGFCWNVPWIERLAVGICCHWSRWIFEKLAMIFFPVVACHHEKRGMCLKPS